MIQVPQIRPDVSVVISDALRTLVRGSAAHRDANPRHVVPVAPQAALGASSGAPAAASGWQYHILRRDGARPLRFTGALLLSLSADTQAGGAVRIDLFAGIGGEVHLHVMLQPVPAVAARDLMRGTTFRDIGDIDPFLSACAPRHALRPHPAACAEARRAQQAAAAALHESYQTLIAALRPHIRRTPERSIPCP